MAAQNSFDVSTGADLQEVDNAVHQALKEIHQRYDFKGSNITIELDKKTGTIAMEADDDYRLGSAWDVLQTKFVRRGVPLKNAKASTVEPAGGGRSKQTISLQQGIPTDTAKAIVKAIKEQKYKKVQASIQGDEVRVSSPSRDDLQAVIQLLKGEDFGVELTFGNYR
jgi:uncharacterized protein YajQ (UPF0234 family)